MIEISKAQYYDNYSLDAVLREKEPFVTTRATGVFARRSQVEGEYRAWSDWQKCTVCHNASYYVVGSYKTTMYEHCQICGHTLVNMAWYSKTTRILQEALARVFPPCHLALVETDQLIEDARNWWRTEQGKGRVKADRLLGYDALGTPRMARKASLHEQIEAYIGHKMAGHWINRAG